MARITPFSRTMTEVIRLRGNAEAYRYQAESCDDPQTAEEWLWLAADTDAHADAMEAAARALINADRVVANAVALINA